MKLALPLSLILAHYVGDWIFQTNWQALNKSKNNQALSLHVLSYSACFLPWGLGFASATFILHWVTDYVTSRATSNLFFFRPTECYTVKGTPYKHWLYIGALRGKFFKMIGADQLIHYVCLALTYRIFFGG